MSAPTPFDPPDPPHPPDGEPGPPDTREIRRVALSGLLGTTIEYYDFLLYGTMAALVLGPLFFPADGSAASTIAAFGTLAAGYVARPVGGILFGHFGDRLGRKAMLVVSMSLMGIASVLIGLLPTYASIGIAAPALLVALRVLQGIAIGGEYSGAALMVVEHADARRRGAWVGVMQLGSPFGFLLSTAAIAAVSALPRDQFTSWGWRIPFLLSALLLLVGLYVRVGVSESPVFKAAERAAAGGGRAERVPLMEILRRPRVLLIACGVGIGPFALTALISSHMIVYASGLGIPQHRIVQSLLCTICVSIVFIPLASAVSDRIGRRRVVLAGAVGAIAVAFPLYAMADTRSWGLMTLGMMVAQLMQNLMYAPLAAMLSEMFGTRTRYTGVSVGYQVSSLVGAGFTPLVAASLMAAYGGSSTPLSVIIVVGACLTIVPILLVRETRGSALVDGDPRVGDGRSRARR